VSTTDFRSDEIISKLMNKEVRYRFHGKDLFFALSMGLFSSNSVDTGTELLLKHLAREIDFSKASSLLDAGCGTGVISIALKSAFPHLAVTALDRDALAVAATRLNARRNKTEIQTVSGLDMTVLDPPYLIGDSDLKVRDKQYDLVVSNIPAKAGLEAHRRFFTNGLWALNPGGLFAVVIVDTLKERVLQLAAELEAPIRYAVDGSRHSVYIIEKPNTPMVPEHRFPGSYKRLSRQFFLHKNAYTLDTVFDLPSFDTPSFDEALISKHVDVKECRTLTCYNPGQGHVLLSLLSRANHVERIHLAGRDLLSLLTTAGNIRKSHAHINITISHIPSIEHLISTGPAPADLAIVLPDPIPRIRWASQLHQMLLSTASQPAHRLAVGAKSSYLSELDQGLPGYGRSLSKKSRGFRVIIFTSLYI
jgi:SAM-dependent methyltransferase